MKNGIDKDMAIGALIKDLGNRSINAVSKAFKISWRKAKKCVSLFDGVKIENRLGNRGRKNIFNKYPNIISDIQDIINQYECEYVNPHFKSKFIYADLTLNNIRSILKTEYNYKNTPCKTKISDILHKMGYKPQRVNKKQGLKKIEETDDIFKNVKAMKNCVANSDNSVAAFSIDDKAIQLIGNLSNNGTSWISKEAYDHDTICNEKVTPFGILDMKTNRADIFCTTKKSTADFKVDCLKTVILSKLETCPNLKTVIIFLDNGPENSSRRTLWLKRIQELSTELNIIILLCYYPPYHSKYNPIERVWACIQHSINGLVFKTIDQYVNALNRISWKNVKMNSTLNVKEYPTGITIDKDEMKEINSYIFRLLGIEKWAVTVIP